MQKSTYSLTLESHFGNNDVTSKATPFSIVVCILLHSAECMCVNRTHGYTRVAQRHACYANTNKLCFHVMTLNTIASYTEISFCMGSSVLSECKVALYMYRNTVPWCSTTGYTYEVTQQFLTGKLAWTVLSSLQDFLKKGLFKRGQSMYIFFVNLSLQSIIFSQPISFHGDITSTCHCSNKKNSVTLHAWIRIFL